MKKIRTIIKHHVFEQAAKLICSDVQRFDEIMCAAEFAIGRNAEAHPRVYGTQLRLRKTKKVGSIPALRIYFTIDNENECTLWYVA